MLPSSYQPRFDENKKSDVDSEMIELQINNNYDEKKEEIKEEKNILAELNGEAHQALYFADFTKFLALRELNFSRNFLRWTLANTPVSLSVLARYLQHDRQMQNATADDINMLIACIVHNSPGFFEKLKSLINTDSISSAVIAQFYYLAIHFKYYSFFIKFKNADLLPPYTVIYIAQQYKLEDQLIKQLWEWLEYPEKHRALNLLFKHSSPGLLKSGLLNKSSLPKYLRDFSLSLNLERFDDDNDEEKDFTPLELPVILLTPQKRKLTQLAKLVKQQDYYSIFREIEKSIVAKGLEREYCYQLLKQFCLEEKEGKEEKSSAATDEMLIGVASLLRSVFGNNIAAYHFVLSDKDLQKNLNAQHRFLRLYFTDNLELLPTQYLANALLSEEPVEMSSVRKLIYLTEEKKQTAQVDSEVLEQKTLLSDDCLKLTPHLEKLGDVRTLAEKLGFSDFKLKKADYLPSVPFSRDVQGIIGEYLDDPNDYLSTLIRKTYRALCPQTIIASQKQYLQKQIASISLLIGELQTVPKRHACHMRLSTISSFLILALTVLFIVLSRLIDRANIQERADMLSSDTWQLCQPNGYYAVSVGDLGDRGNPPMVLKGECKTLENYTRTLECDRFCTDYSNIAFPLWLFILDNIGGFSSLIAFIFLVACIVTRLENRYRGVVSPVTVPKGLLTKINVFLDSVRQPRLNVAVGADGIVVGDALNNLQEQKTKLDGRLSSLAPAINSSSLISLSIVNVDHRKRDHQMIKTQSDQDDDISAPLLTGDSFGMV